MKKILTYYELINEELLIKNKKLVKSYAKEIEMTEDEIQEYINGGMILISQSMIKMV